MACIRKVSSHKSKCKCNLQVRPNWLGLNSDSSGATSGKLSNK